MTSKNNDPPRSNPKWTPSFMEMFAKEWLKHQFLLPNPQTDGMPEKVVRTRICAERREMFTNLNIPKFRPWTTVFLRHYKRMLKKKLKSVRAKTLEEALSALPPWVRDIELHFNEIPKVLQEIRPNIAPDKNQLLLDVLRAMWKELRDNGSEGHKLEFWTRAINAASSECGYPSFLIRKTLYSIKTVAMQKLRLLQAVGDRLAAGSPNRLLTADWLAVDLLLAVEPQETLLDQDSLKDYDQLATLTALFSIAQMFQLDECLRGTAADSEKRWKDATQVYIHRGLSSSMVVLQRRWYELVQLSRNKLAAFRRGSGAVPPPLCKQLAIRFPQLVTSPLPAWCELVRLGRVALPDYADMDAQHTPCELAATKPPLYDDGTNDDIILIEKDIETIDLDGLESDDEDKLIIDERIKIDKMKLEQRKRQIKEEIDTIQSEKQFLEQRKQDICTKLDSELDCQLKYINKNQDNRQSTTSNVKSSIDWSLFNKATTSHSTEVSGNYTEVDLTESDSIDGLSTLAHTGANTLKTEIDITEHKITEKSLKIEPVVNDEIEEKNDSNIEIRIETETMNSQNMIASLEELQTESTFSNFAVFEELDPSNVEAKIIFSDEEDDCCNSKTFNHGHIDKYVTNQEGTILKKQDELVDQHIVVKAENISTDTAEKEMIFNNDTQLNNKSDFIINLDTDSSDFERISTKIKTADKKLQKDKNVKHNSDYFNISKPSLPKKKRIGPKSFMRRCHEEKINNKKQKGPKSFPNILFDKLFTVSENNGSIPAETIINENTEQTLLSLVTISKKEIISDEESKANNVDVNKIVNETPSSYLETIANKVKDTEPNVDKTKHTEKTSYGRFSFEGDNAEFDERKIPLIPMKTVEAINTDNKDTFLKSPDKNSYSSTALKVETNEFNLSEEQEIGDLQMDCESDKDKSIDTNEKHDRDSINISKPNPPKKKPIGPKSFMRRCQEKVNKKNRKGPKSFPNILFEKLLTVSENNGSIPAEAIVNENTEKPPFSVVTISKKEITTDEEDLNLAENTEQTEINKKSNLDKNKEMSLLLFEKSIPDLKSAKNDESKAANVDVIKIVNKTSSSSLETISDKVKVTESDNEKAKNVKRLSHERFSFEVSLNEEDSNLIIVENSGQTEIKKEFNLDNNKDTSFLCCDKCIPDVERTDNEKSKANNADANKLKVKASSTYLETISNKVKYTEPNVDETKNTEKTSYGRFSFEGDNAEFDEGKIQIIPMETNEAFKADGNNYSTTAVKFEVNESNLSEEEGSGDLQMDCENDKDENEDGNSSFGIGASLTNMQCNKDQLLMPAQIPLYKIDELSFWKKHASKNTINISKININLNPVKPRRLKPGFRPSSWTKPVERLKRNYSHGKLLKNPDFNIFLQGLDVNFILKNAYLLAVVCKPITVDIERMPMEVLEAYLAEQNCSEQDEDLRPRKKVELADIEEVRRINKRLLTAQVRPIVAEQEIDLSSDSESDVSFVMDVEPATTDPGDDDPNLNTLTLQQLDDVLTKLAKLDRKLKKKMRQEKKKAKNPSKAKTHCCPARRHVNYNKARARVAARGGRSVNMVDIHRKLGGSHANLKCECCCLNALRGMQMNKVLLAENVKALHSDLLSLVQIKQKGERSKRAATPLTHGPIAKVSRAKDTGPDDTDEELLPERRKTKDGKEGKEKKRGVKRRKKEDEKKPEKDKKKPVGDKNIREKYKMTPEQQKLRIEEEEYEEWLRQRNKYAKYFTINAPASSMTKQTNHKVTTSNKRIAPKESTSQLTKESVEINENFEKAKEIVENPNVGKTVHNAQSNIEVNKEQSNIEANKEQSNIEGNMTDTAVPNNIENNHEKKKEHNANVNNIAEEHSYIKIHPVTIQPENILLKYVPHLTIVPMTSHQYDLANEDPMTIILTDKQPSLKYESESTTSATSNMTISGSSERTITDLERKAENELPQYVIQASVNTDDNLKQNNIPKYVIEASPANPQDSQKQDELPQYAIPSATANEQTIMFKSYTLGETSQQNQDITQVQEFGIPHESIMKPVKQHVVTHVTGKPDSPATKYWTNAITQPQIKALIETSQANPGLKFMKVLQCPSNSETVLATCVAKKDDPNQTTLRLITQRSNSLLKTPSIVEPECIDLTENVNDAPAQKHQVGRQDSGPSVSQPVQNIAQVSQLVRTLGHPFPVTMNHQKFQIMRQTEQPVQTVEQKHQLSQPVQTVGQVNKLGQPVQTVGQVNQLVQAVQAVRQMEQFIQPVQTVGQVHELGQPVQTIQSNQFVQPIQTVGQINQLVQPMVQPVQTMGQANQLVQPFGQSIQTVGQINQLVQPMVQPVQTMGQANQLVQPFGRSIQTMGQINQIVQPVQTMVHANQIVQTLYQPVQTVGPANQLVQPVQTIGQANLPVQMIGQANLDQKNKGKPLRQPTQIPVNTTPGDTLIPATIQFKPLQQTSQPTQKSHQVIIPTQKSHQVVKLAQKSYPVIKPLQVSQPVQKSIQISKPVQKSVQVSQPGQKSTHISRPVQKSIQARPEDQKQRIVINSGKVTITTPSKTKLTQKSKQIILNKFLDEPQTTKTMPSWIKSTLIPKKDESVKNRAQTIETDNVIEIKDDLDENVNISYCGSMPLISDIVGNYDMQSTTEIPLTSDGEMDVSDEQNNPSPSRSGSKEFLKVYSPSKISFPRPQEPIVKTLMSSESAQNEQMQQSLLELKLQLHPIPPLQEPQCCGMEDMTHIRRKCFRSTDLSYGSPQYVNDIVKYILASKMPLSEVQILSVNTLKPLFKLKDQYIVVTEAVTANRYLSSFWTLNPPLNFSQINFSRFYKPPLKVKKLNLEEELNKQPAKQNINIETNATDISDTGRLKVKAFAKLPGTENALTLPSDNLQINIEKQDNQLGTLLVDAQDLMFLDNKCFKKLWEDPLIYAQVFAVLSDLSVIEKTAIDKKPLCFLNIRERRLIPIQQREAESDGRRVIDLVCPDAKDAVKELVKLMNSPNEFGIPRPTKLHVVYTSLAVDMARLDVTAAPSGVASGHSDVIQLDSDDDA